MYRLLQLFIKKMLNIKSGRKLPLDTVRVANRSPTINYCTLKDDCWGQQSVQIFNKCKR